MNHYAQISSYQLILLKSSYKFAVAFIRNRNWKLLSGETQLPCYLQPNLLLLSSIIVKRGV